ncbi:MAG: hypothetical protein LBD45_03090 [Bacteroidales bacterium]|jgi:hypothetical protein|nr:hypothetical protein [Bacteroidales bacterium]
MKIFNKNISFRKEHGVAIFFILFLTRLFYLLVVTLNKGFSKEGWNITEFLINYEGGFVRRGLTGELLLKLYQLFHIDVYWTIIIVCLIAYVLLAVFFVKGFVKKGLPVFILPFVFFLGGPIIQEFLIRKDILLALLFILVLRFSLKKTVIAPIIANLLLILAILIHETAGFYAFPVLILIYLHKYKSLFSKGSYVKAGLLSCLTLLPSVYMFLAVIHFHGDAGVARSIWDSWGSVPFLFQDGSVPISAIDAIAWSLKDTAILTWDYLLMARSAGIVGIIAWCVILPSIYYVLSNSNKLDFPLLGHRPSMSFNPSLLSSLLIMQFITVFPLFCIAMDYGRWIFNWVVSTFIIFLVLPEKNLSAIIPSWISAASREISRFLNTLAGNSRGVVALICMMISFPYFKWDFLYTATTNSVVIVLQFISMLVAEMAGRLGIFVSEIVI